MNNLENKNIYIGGVARSGKSTLAEKICHEKKYNHLPLDYITASLKRNFPQCEINSKIIINDTSKKLALLLSTVIEIINNKDEKFIIDSAHIMPNDIIKYLDQDKWDIYFFGYPNISKEEKFALIRKYDPKTSWTAKRTDEELLDIIEQLINISKTIQEQCRLLNIPFIDTSRDILKPVLEIINNQ